VVRLFIIIAGLSAFLGCGLAVAQTDQTKGNSATTGTVRTPPEDKGQLQPQGWTGPINTQTGGAPAESPQGQSPPGMQAAPEGSTKTVVEPRK
jgi:hypothetical protein